MASEDTQRLRWLPEVHSFGDRRDLYQTVDRQMPTLLHQGEDRRELVEVIPLRRQEGMGLEERDDDVPELAPSLNAVAVHVLPVIIEPGVFVHLPTSKERNESFQDVVTRCALRYRKLGPDLPPECHRAATIDGTAETGLSIYEPRNPPWADESFLLIFRTSHIVTA